MKGGYAGKLLRVDLNSGTINTELLDPKIAFNFLGGRGYGAWILYRELKRGTGPLGPANRLIFMTGPLTGTPFPGSGRTAVVFKSPLTGTIADSSMGGFFGAWLKRAGFDGLIVQGRSKKPVYIEIDDDKVTLHDATELWGKSTLETIEELLDRYPQFSIATIGPAGENLARMACVVTGNREGRMGVAGRCGGGAVMGSKNLKAVVVRGTKRVPVAHPPEFQKILTRVRKVIETNPITGTDGTLARFGTAMLVHRITAGGLLPAWNFSGKELSFEDVDPFSGETVRERYLVKKIACFGCPTGCGRWVRVKNWEGKGPEYESIVMLGPNAGFFDYQQIAKLSAICDELGLDTISMGVALGVAREAGICRNFEDAVRLVNDIGRGKSPFSLGTVAAAKKLKLKVFVPHCKKLELPAYDPRGAKGIALAYATSNRGGCHLRAYTIDPEILGHPEFVDPQTEDGKPELVKRLQDASAVYDSLVVCKYHSLALFSTLDFELYDFAELLTALTGVMWTEKHLREVGARIYDVERRFNVREGFEPAQDRLPAEFGLDLTQMLQRYYKLRGWGKRGVPSRMLKLKTPKRAKEIPVGITPIERLRCPALQVALDLDADLKTVVRIARAAYRGGAQIVEAGTPALKRHGTDRLIPELRKVAPDALIVADLKTMDVGNLEAKIAFRAGADIAAVLGIGGRTKIFEALSEAIRWNRAILIDFIDCPDPIALTEELARQFEGRENHVIFCLHRGISEQLRGRGIYDSTTLIAEAKKRCRPFLLAVAGGIKEGVAKEVVRAGADICIAGSAIYNTSNPERAARRIVAEIKQA